MKTRPNRLSDVTERLKQLQIGDNFVADVAPEGSIKSIVSRLRRHYKGRRRFKTMRVGEATIVVRLP